MADDALSIDFELKGLADILRGFKQVGDEAKKTGKGVDSAVKAKGTGGTGAAAQARASAQAQIFAARVQTAQAARQHREQVNALRLQKEQYRLSRVMRPKGEPNFTKRLTSFVRSTRFGAAGAQPLVGQGLDLAESAGLGEAAGPIGLFSTALFEAIKAVKALADASAKATGEFSSMRYSTGGTLKETAQLKGLANAIQISPDQAAGVAAGIDSASTSGGLGAAYALKAGIDIRKAPFGSTDRAKKALQALKYIANDKDANDATNFARQTGSDAFLPIRDLSPAARANAIKQAENGYYTQQQITKGADYNASVSNLSNARERFGARVGGAAQGVLTPINNGAAQTLNDMSDPATMTRIEGTSIENASRPFAINPAFESATPRARAAYARYLSHRTMSGPQALASAKGMSTDAAERLAMRSVGRGAEYDHVKALRAHTKALMKNSNLLGYEGSFGNASRGDFMPGGMGGQSLHHALEKQGYQLGAF